MYKHGLKRMIDFIFVSIVLFLILPVLLLVTFVLCFVNKRAGAFFTQERPGRRG
ncbi:MAG TPA: sugar transferase, partial [Bacteroides cellulosilyticus]|nr:sugar transferase [Bacteroides cellulosilyticus]